MEDLDSYERLMRGENGAPPTLFVQLRCPTINKAYIQERLVLPDQFLGACTLKEGTFVTILWLQSVAVAFSAYLLVYIMLWWDYGNFVWLEKFKADFDPYLEKDPVVMAKVAFLAPLWDDMAFAMAMTHIAYFVTGLGVCYGLCNNHCHPAVYVPWLLFTGFLVACCYFAVFVMFSWLFYMKRYISVTWDIVPMVCVFLYALAWSYGYLVAIAHYKRRCIVRFWCKNKRKEFGGD